MPTKYYVNVSAPDEHFTAYVEDDLDSAVGHAEFLAASLPGAKVSIDQVDWDLEDR